MPRSIRILITVIALLVVTAACGDDDTTATSSTPSDATTSTTATGSTAVPTDSASGSSFDGSELAARYATTPLRLTYLMGPSDDQNEMVIAQDPTAVPPVESIQIPAEGAKIIISEGTTIFCDGSGGGCFQLAGAAGESLATSLLGPFSQLLQYAPSALGTLTVTEEPITVAGRAGTCFTYVPTPVPDADTDLIRQCIDNELGFTLLLQSSQTGNDDIETVMELIGFATPTAEDFEPTGPVTATP